MFLVYVSVVIGIDRFSCLHGVSAKPDQGVLLLYGYITGPTFLKDLASVPSTTCRSSYFLEQHLVVWVQAEQVDSLSGPTVRCGPGDAIRGQGGKRGIVRAPG